MARTVAGKRPATGTITAAGVLGKLKELRFGREHAERLLEIAAEVGVKSECVPGGGVVTITRASRGAYTITDKMEV